MKIIDPQKLKQQVLLSVDLGAKGGLCWNGIDTTFGGRKLFTEKIPETPKDIAKEIYHKHASIVVAEDVRSWQAHSGALMVKRGILEGICAAYNLPVVFIEPQVWMKCFTHKNKKHFDDNDTKWKKHLIEIAEGVFGMKGLSSGEADAIMMWNFYASIIVNDRMRPIGELQFS